MKKKIEVAVKRKTIAAEKSIQHMKQILLKFNEIRVFIQFCHENYTLTTQIR